MSRTSSPASERYTRTAVCLHWLIGVALFGQIAFGFLLGDRNHVLSRMWM